MDWLDLLMKIGFVVFGGLSLYLQYSKKYQEIKAKAATLIEKAEEEYKDVTKAGGVKKAWVVDQLYALVPKPFNMIITKNMIDDVVESTFIEIEKYAKSQLDKILDGIK